MKNVIQFAIALLLLCSIQMRAQEEGNDLNVLTAPVSPASNLIGTAVTDIDKPTEVSEFMASLQTASESFTRFPLNYAVDFAPFLLFDSDVGDITTAGLAKPEHVFEQSLVLSLAVKTTDSSETVLNKESTYGAFGFRFSVVRGDYDTKTKEKLEAIGELQDKKIAELENEANLIDLSPEILMLRQQRREELRKSPRDADALAQIDTLIGKATARILEKAKANRNTELDAEISKIAAEFQIARVGFTWDVAGGISAEFVDRNFEKARVNNAGLWTTLGYTSEKYGSFLGLMRYLHNPDKIFAFDDAPNIQKDISTFDAGARYVYGTSQSRFNLSLEAVYRSALNTEFDSSWRLVFNADYAIVKNQKLTFSFGRNFDGTITKNGNLIAALGFVKGFGNQRSVK